MNESVKADGHQIGAVNKSQQQTSQLDTDEKTTWILAFGVLLVVATVGNSLVTWFIIGKEDKSIRFIRLFKRDFISPFSTLFQSISTAIEARRRLAKAHSCFMLSLTMADFAMLYLEGVFNFIYILDGYTYNIRWNISHEKKAKLNQKCVHALLL
jgi:hypothetical protein